MQTTTTRDGAAAASLKMTEAGGVYQFLDSRGITGIRKKTSRLA
ncbi:MAG: hypothetical protein NTW75_12210 [Planctomycetales bacterium]|nr:hypothetical protein [Planctomycetales bacterium]